MTHVLPSRSKVPPLKIVAVGVALAGFFFLQIMVSWMIFLREKTPTKKSETPSIPAALPAIRAVPQSLPPEVKSEVVPKESSPLPETAITAPPPEQERKKPPLVQPEVSVHHFEQGVPVAYEDSPQ